MFAMDHVLAVMLSDALDSVVCAPHATTRLTNSQRAHITARTCRLMGRRVSRCRSPHRYVRWRFPLRVVIGRGHSPTGTGVRCATDHASSAPRNSRRSSCTRDAARPPLAAEASVPGGEQLCNTEQNDSSVQRSRHAPRPPHICPDLLSCRAPESAACLGPGATRPLPRHRRMRM